MARLASLGGSLHGFDALLISQSSLVVLLWMVQALKTLFSWAFATELSLWDLNITSKAEVTWEWKAKAPSAASVVLPGYPLLC